MTEPSAAEKEQLWNDFVQRWPLSSLRNMSLADYNSAGTKDSFCYWVEDKTRVLGSIKGGSAFKFGVYERKDRKPKEDKGGRRYSDTHAWMDKYGESVDEAFKNSLAEVVKVAEAARAGDLETVESANLGEVFRWKIAFLYQDPNNLSVAPVYLGKYIKGILRQPNISVKEGHSILMAKRQGKNVFDYGSDINQQIRDLEIEEEQKFDSVVAKEYLDQCTVLQKFKEPTSKLAGYETSSGEQLALSLKNKDTVTLFCEPGPWQEEIEDSDIEFKPYDATTSRNSHLAANAPRLAKGNPATHVTVATIEALIEVCEAYSGESDESEMATEDRTGNENSSLVPSEVELNQILYGPPGTGKTYVTTLHAVSIADPTWKKNTFDAIPDGSPKKRIALKTRYQELVKAERIVFTTFHQSFSYEDFIEGIRASQSEDGTGLSYDVEAGVFKRIAEQANKAVGQRSIAGLSEVPTVWKISIGRTHESTRRERCLSAGEARIGWNDTGDLTAEYDERTPEQQSYWDTLSNKSRSSINSFAESMKIGDVLLCMKDLESVQAVGIVESEYRHDDTAAAQEGKIYAHTRKVNWVLKDIDLNILAINEQRRMGRQTMHRLDRIGWEDLVLELKKQGYKLPIKENNISTEKPNHVLIIDEINRGNTSRIFGEMITLLEPDKRKGATDERSITLPYSKEAFSVPSNLYIIGTMNTADKSLAQMDLALRRRFSFIETPPQSHLLQGTEVHKVDLADLLTCINQRIEALLDAEHMIGHAYLLGLQELPSGEREKSLAKIFKNKIIPLLQEYFFDDYERIGWVLNDPSKDAENRFIQSHREMQNLPALSKLFSADVVEQITDRRFRINEKAFDKAEAYRGILA